METKTYHHVHDRNGWPAGPWDDEPDKTQWADEATGLPCLAVRNRMGAWCGYVGVAEGHPAYARDYGDVDVRVHGGLTFADIKGNVERSNRSGSTNLIALMRRQPPRRSVCGLYDVCWIYAKSPASWPAHEEN